MSRLLEMSSDWFGCAKLFRIRDTAPVHLFVTCAPVLLKSITNSTSRLSSILQLGVPGPVLLGAGGWTVAYTTRYMNNTAMFIWSGHRANLNFLLFTFQSSDMDCLFGFLILFDKLYANVNYIT